MLCWSLCESVCSSCSVVRHCPAASKRLETAYLLHLSHCDIIRPAPTLHIRSMAVAVSCVPICWFQIVHRGMLITDVLRKERCHILLREVLRRRCNKRFAAFVHTPTILGLLIGYFDEGIGIQSNVDRAVVGQLSAFSRGFHHIHIRRTAAFVQLDVALWRSDRGALRCHCILSLDSESSRRTRGRKSHCKLPN